MTFKTQVWLRYGIWLALSILAPIILAGLAWMLADTLCIVFFSNQYLMSYKQELLRWLLIIIITGSVTIGQILRSISKGGWDVWASRMGGIELKTLAERLLAIAEEKDKEVRKK